MTTDFSALKKASKTNFKSLTDKITKASQSYEDEDENFWKLTLDKSKNGYAVIRFLPAPIGEDLPYVEYFDHFFKGPTGKYYTERSLTSLGKDDPVSEYNKKLWDSGIDANKAKARDQKRKRNFVAGIKVINDPANPENNGKIFKFRFGKTIFDKLAQAMMPSEEEMALDPDITPINVFDFWEGANFKMKARDKDGWVNYDNSVFEAPSAIAETDEEIEKIWKSQYSLKDEVAETKYKDYDTLKKRLNLVLQLDSVGEENKAVSEEDNTELPKQVAKQEEAIEAETNFSSDVDEDLDYFERLAS